MNKSLYPVFIILITLSSCELFNRENQKSLDLTQIVRNVMAGKDSTSKLSILRDKELPPAVNPNLVHADTLSISGKRYYYVIAEYPDPVYNRFTILDSYYNVLLVDKSLNGYLAVAPFYIDHINFVKVEEIFVSKGILGLKRISLYSIDNEGEAGLVFRTFTELSEPGITYKQDISSIDHEDIQTKIYSTSKEELKLDQDHDIFHFTSEMRKYASHDNFFDDFVVSEVRQFDAQTIRPEIISRESYLKQRGIKTSRITTDHKLGKFSMPLTTEWNEVKDVKISEPLNKPITGTRFINNHYGAEISVVQIPRNDSSESYIRYPFENISTGNYRVRFSEKISGAKYYYQFFEYSCANEKFLLILQTLKTTYDLYKSDYQLLINSFSMDC